MTNKNISPAERPDRGRYWRRWFASLALLFVCPVVAFADCGVVGTCNDATESFGGVIVVEGVKAEWTTSNEDLAIGYFALKRYDCSDPSECSVTVALIPAVGICGQQHDYSYTDDPPDPVSSWTYTLETWRTNGLRACAIDMIPE